jgi:iron complex outermembrane receptor protein
MFYRIVGRPALITGLSMGLFAAPVMAQLEEITVTARRVEESLQNAPVAVTAFTAENLQNARIRNVGDLAKYVPNLTFEGGETGRRAAPVLRGVGLIDSRGFDNAVGVFIDGVFVSGRAAQNIQMLDLERVEVVRGPQNALYGRSTFAGAINYVTRKPGDEFDAYMEATAAQSEFFEVMGAISGPIVGDTLSGRLGFSYTEDEGMFSNGPVGAGDGIGGAETKSINGALRWQPSDTVDLMLSAFYSDEFVANRPLSVNPNNCGELDPDLSSITAASYDRGVPLLYCGEVQPLEGTSLSLSPDAYSQDGDTTRLALDMTFDLGAASLHSITSWTRNKNLSKVDLDRNQAGEPFYGYVSLADWEAAGSPAFQPAFELIFPNSGVGTFNTYFGATGQDQNYWSQELRLSSNSEGRLRWNAGVFYFRAENDDTSFVGIDATDAINDLGLSADEIQFLLVTELAPGGPLAAIPTPILPNQVFTQGSEMTNLILAQTEVSQYSAFGSAEFDFTDRLTGTFELRYTYEERTLTNVFDDFFGSPTGSFTNDWSFIDPRAILRYQATDDAMIYGSIAKGTRSGGQNPAIADPALVPYDEETNWTYEIGAKTGWFDNRLQVNAAAFYMDWQDAQFRQRTPSVGQGGGLLTITTNATGITSYGAELEVVAAPFEGFEVGGSYGFADSTFDDGTVATGEARYCDAVADPNLTAFPQIPVDCVEIPGLDPQGNPDLAPDLSGNRLLRTSRHTASFFTQVTRPIVADTDAFLRLDMSYRSKQNMDNAATHFSPGRTLTSLRLGVQNPRYDVMFWVENLTNEDAVESTQSFPSDLNSLLYRVTAININPRRLGVTARFRFGADGM